MADVYNLNSRNDIENHAFDRSHEMIIETKVGGERNDGPMRQGFSRSRH